MNDSAQNDSPDEATPKPGVPQTDTIMLVAFEGWNDAADAASTAIEHLQLTWDATPLADIDPDPYYDFQVNRPTSHIVDGVNRRIEWPTTRLTSCHPDGGEREVILVHGLEPNMHWKRFCGELVAIAESHNVSMVFMLGAMLADTPHSRPVPVSGTAYDAATAERFKVKHSDYEGPTGILGVLNVELIEAGIPTVSLWAQVPHYVSHPPCPKATLALLHRVEEILDIEVPLGALPDQSEEWEHTVTDMISEDEDVQSYVRALEERGDASEVPLTEASGDAIAAEFEKYLRRRGGKP